VLLIFSIVIWKVQESRNTALFEESTKSSLRTYISESENRFVNISEALDRLASRGVPGDFISVQEWQADAVFYQEAFAGLESLAYVDNTLVVRQLTLVSDPVLSIGDTVASLQTQPGCFLLFSPSYNGSEFNGFVLGRVNIEPFLTPVIKEIGDRYMLQVYHEGDTIFQSENWIEPDPEHIIIRRIELHDTATLKINFAPTRIALLETRQNSINILIYSLTFSLISVAGVFLAQNYKNLSDQNMARYQHLFTASQDAIFMINSRGEYLDINPAAVRMTGYSREEIRQLTVDDIRDDGEDLSEETRAELWGKGGMQQLSLRHKQGTAVPVELTISPVRVNKELDYILGIARDITDRIQAEEELRGYQDHLEKLVETRTQQLEEINQELTDFAYVVSHDLKAPLRAIIQLSNWISEDYRDRLDEEGQEKISLLVNRTNRMHNLIEGILDYSRIGRIEEHNGRVDLKQLIERVAGLFEAEDHIQLSIENQFPVVVGSRIRIEQVFQNLLDNAYKFMDKKPGKISIRCKENQREWVFSVEDNGPGIASDYHQKIFQMFQTLHSWDELESTGIGLALVKKIVEGWNGRLWVESKPGKGSTFFFTIPKEMEYEEQSL
jgi:PAS domain S-box-containing protein